MKARRLNNRARNSQPGWILIELLIAVGILAVLMVAMGPIQSQLKMFNSMQWTRGRCITASQGQLDSIAATGSPIADKDIQRLWPGIQVQIQLSPGQGDWQGLTLLSVTAIGKSHGKDVKVELARYITPPEEK